LAQLIFALVECILFVTSGRKDLYSISYLVLCITTVLFTVEGYFAAYNYDKFLSTAFVLYLFVRELVYFWQIWYAVVTNRPAPYWVFALIGAICRVLYIYLGFKFTYRLYNEGPPDDLPMETENGTQTAGPPYGSIKFFSSPEVTVHI